MTETVVTDSPALSNDRKITEGSAPPVTQDQQAEGKAAASPVAPRKKQFFASIYPGPETPLPEKFADLVLQLQAAIGAPIWLLVQNDQSEWGEIQWRVFQGIQGSA